MNTQGRQKLTWYHLVSRKDSASGRDNGRTRKCLPIDTSAPRPCSADPDLSHHTNRDSLKGIACVLSLSQLFSNIPAHYTGRSHHLSTFKLYLIVVCGGAHVGEGQYPALTCVDREVCNKLRLNLFASQTMPPPRRTRRPPAYPRSWAPASPEQIPL